MNTNNRVDVEDIMRVATQLGTACNAATATPTATTNGPTATATATATATPNGPTATSTSTATATATTNPTTPAWISYVNQLRALAGLAPVTENAAYSAGDVKHARYMVKNGFIGHTEDLNNQWYTAEGLLAAQNANVSVDSNINAPDESAINGWMVGPFHGIGIIDPTLQQVGFGSYHENTNQWRTAATLDVLRGRTGTGTYPVKWPSTGAPVWLKQYDGNESPDPLASCAGYTAPAGLPIYLQIGNGSLTPNVTATSFKQGATELEHSVFDETSYTNPNGGQQTLGRQVLDGRDAIVLLPKNPLTPGQTYTVSITTNGQTHTWSFTVSATAAAAGPETRRLSR
ncbi:MAG: CAP domain-containing protein [Chloroflexi bacterium]|nr:CAP domain-containing protein [Chloroflexota bacterium]